MSARVTAQFIAEALGVTTRAVQLRAKAEHWISVPKRTQGGTQNLYFVGPLPKDVKDKVLARELAAATAAPLPAPIAEAASELKEYQSGPLAARQSLITEVKRLREFFGYSTSQAIDQLIRSIAAGTLSPVLMAAVPIANARWAPGRTLSRATVFNWLKAADEPKAAPLALAPKAAPEAAIPIWGPTFLKLWGRPQKPNMTDVLRAWPGGEEKPSYDQVRHFLKRLDPITKQSGRIGHKSMMARKAYVVRDTSELWPGAVFIGDGHTYKAEVAHPIHGRPFRPEITVFLDVHTRKWVGWSAALAENTWSVADALRHAITTTTACDIVYYDNGSGAKNNAWDADATGLAAMLGITKLHSAPWSSQARGIVERFNSTVLHRGARRYETYVGQRMDDDARRAVFKKTRADIKAVGASKLLPSWSEFLADIDGLMAEYNSQPHSALPKGFDRELGKRRHMCPNEIWDHWIEKGWTPQPITEAEARHLFRPQVKRKVSRAIVRWLDNEYFHPDLEAFHGEEVIVGYDIHDAGKVRVRALDGRFICEAVWGGNKRSYIPISMAEHAHEQRLKGRESRLQAHLDEVRAEAGPGLIEHLPITPMEPVAFSGEAEIIEFVPKTSPEEREAQAKDARFARWRQLEAQLQAGAAIEPEDREWHGNYGGTAECRARLRAERL